MNLSALILTYNEGRNIAAVVQRVSEVLGCLSPSFEVVVMDGGSRDDTEEQARQAGAVVYRQQKPGYGAAFAEGLERCRGEWIVTLDADLSHDPERVQGLWERREDVDLVIGSRYVRGGSYDMTPFRKFLSHFMNGTYRLVLELPIQDLSSGFRLYRRAAVVGLPLTSPLFDVLEEILIQMVNRGCRVLEIPIHYAPRQHGESHLRVVKFGLAYYHTLVKLARLRHHPAAADFDVRAGRSILPWRRTWAAGRRSTLESLPRPLLDVGGLASALGVGGEVLAVASTVDRLRVLPPDARVRAVVHPQNLPFPDGVVAGACIADPAFVTPEALFELRRVLRPAAQVWVESDRVGPGTAASMQEAGWTRQASGIWITAGSPTSRPSTWACPRCAVGMTRQWPPRTACPACGASFGTDAGVFGFV
ncbi:MAG: glycosyltransferase [Candidatus Xenobia bacterium]